MQPESIVIDLDQDNFGCFSCGWFTALIEFVRAMAQVAETAEVISSQTVAKALKKVNADVRTMATDSGHVCGSTVAALPIDHQGCTVLWAGDSHLTALATV